MRNLFNQDMDEITINKPIRLIELFGGYGSQFMAMKRIGAKVESWLLCEFDPYAVKSFNAIHGTNYKPSDVRELHGKDLKIVEKDKYCYMLTYSFPCTDLSVAGKMQGMSKADWENGKSTRSGLLWEVERILDELPKEDLPQVLFMENVPQVLGEKNLLDFRKWEDYLTRLGYTNYIEVLNAKDYGVAQNRERCFMFSFLGEVYYEFPEKIKLQKKMKDYLEDNVEEKYYLKSEKARRLIESLISNGTLERATSNRTEQNRTEQNRTEQNYGRLTEVSTIQKSSRLQTVSRQGMKPESATCSRTATVLLRGIRGNSIPPSVIKTDVACTVVASNYKGISNFGDNGVLEW